MPSRNLGERKSFECDADVGFDGQGYLLKRGNDGPEHVRKTEGPTDLAIGVNYTSTYDEQDEEILEGWRVPVIHDGYPNVLCAEGYEYNVGDAVYVSDPANADGYEGVATADDDPAGDGSVDPTQIGTVMSHADLTGEDGPTLVQIDVTNNLGDS